MLEKDHEAEIRARVEQYPIIASVEAAALLSEINRLRAVLGQAANAVFCASLHSDPQLIDEHLRKADAILHPYFRRRDRRSVATSDELRRVLGES